MMPSAAPDHFPYLDHRTVAELDTIEEYRRVRAKIRFDALDAISRQRALTVAESIELERVMKVAA